MAPNDEASPEQLIPIGRGKSFFTSPEATEGYYSMKTPNLVQSAANLKKDISQ